LLLGTPPRLHRFATLLTRAPPAVRFASQPPVTGAVTLLRPSSRHAAPPTPFALGLASDGSRSFSPKKISDLPGGSRPLVRVDSKGQRPLAAGGVACNPLPSWEARESAPCANRLWPSQKVATGTPPGLTR